MQLPLVLLAQAPVPELGIRPGDRVLVWCRGGSPIQLQRDLVPNYGRILGAYMDGRLTPLEPSDREGMAVFAQQPSAAAPTVRAPRRRRHAPRLRLIR